MNHLAYQGIKQGTINKLLDKRALQNEIYYEQLEKESADIISKMDFKKIEEEN